MKRIRMCNEGSHCGRSRYLHLIALQTVIFLAISPFRLPAQSAAVSEIIQGKFFKTGMDAQQRLAVPSPDPSGITYHTPSGHLFIADSEISEIPEAWAAIQANVFEVSLNGDTLFHAYNLTDEAKTGAKNREPAGIAYSDFDGYFYIVNDDTHTLYRYERVGDENGYTLIVRDRVDLKTVAETADMKGDLEGVAVDPDTGLIYALDGFDSEIAVFAYTDTFEFVRRMPVWHENGKRLKDPEGIAISPASGHIFVVSSRKDVVLELSLGGEVLHVYSTIHLRPAQKAIQGLTFAPTAFSAFSRNPQYALFIADGGIDNSVDEDERDGIIYETFVIPELKKANEKRAEIKRRFSLHQNFPNPFNASTNIVFSLHEDAKVNIVLYDILGQKVMMIADRFYPAGAHKITLDSTRLPNGIYYYKMQVLGSVQTRSFSLIK